MKRIGRITVGGLQQKIFNLMLIFILALVGAYMAVSAYQARNLERIVREAEAGQQASITEISEKTMHAVLENTMKKSTALQAYIAGDLFGDVEATDAEQQMFGVERMVEALNRRPEEEPEAILAGVREAVDAFVGEAEQFDDLTMLCVEYRGRGR
ncbi:MAG: SpoIIE family protein phosphatase [Oscillospiraceae bacterium]|nr:SpoIIE family protein phosphatase [Oscillospiraceae bacterium]